MHDQPQLTDDQLRLATSRHLPPGAALDSSTAASRDHFLTLGAALESAPGEIDESAIIARLSPQQPCASANSRKQTCSRSRPADQLWPLLFGAALAASALFAIVRIATMPSEANQPIAIVTEPKQETSIQQPAPATNRPTTTWNDPLDDEIALAAATIAQYRSPAPHFDNSLYDMNIQLEALSQELLRESL